MLSHHGCDGPVISQAAARALAQDRLVDVCGRPEIDEVGGDVGEIGSASFAEFKNFGPNEVRHDLKEFDVAESRCIGELFIARSSITAPVQVSRTPASRDYRGARTTGVREAPRHEIAGRKGLGFADAVYGDLRRARVCFREVGTTNALQFDELSGRGEGALPALGSGSALRRRLQDVGAASASERRRRWLTIGGENGKNGRRCVVVDNVILSMTYRS